MSRDTPPELSDLASRIEAAWQTWFTSPTKYTDVLAVLPALIITPAHFAAYGGLHQVAAISAVRLDDPWRARELLRGPAWEAAARVGEGQSYHHIFFGPTNVRIHMVHVEQQAGEMSEALRLADDIDITQIPSLERKTSHLYQVARAYECKGQ